MNVTVNTAPPLAATVGIAVGSDNSGVYQTQLPGGTNPNPGLTALRSALRLHYKSGDPSPALRPRHHQRRLRRSDADRRDATVEPGHITAGPAFGPGATPPTLQIPATGIGQVRLAANALYLANGTGYRFRDFTAPATSSNPAILLAPTMATTYTANYDVACYQLNVTAVPSAGGSVSLNPPAGIASGFPCNCYAPNTLVTLTATATTGNSLTNFTGDGSGTNAVIQVTMNAPKNDTANFGAAASVLIRLTSKPVNINASLNITRTGGSPSATNPNTVQVGMPPTGTMAFVGVFARYLRCRCLLPIPERLHYAGARHATCALHQH